MEKRDIGKHLVVNKNSIAEPLVFDTQWENDGATNSEDRNFEAFGDLADNHDQKLYQFHKLTAWEERCLEFFSEVALPLRPKRRLSFPVISNDMNGEKSYVIESLGSFSSTAGCVNYETEYSATMNGTIEERNNLPSQIKFKNQKSEEKKSKPTRTSALPPLVEGKYSNCPSTEIGQYPVGEFSGRKKEFDVPALVLSQAEDEFKDKASLKLPKIESAARLESGHLHIPALSAPEPPNRLAVPGFIEPFKSFRPPVLPLLEDKNSRMGSFRLPLLGTRDAVSRICDKNEKEPNTKNLSS